MILKFSDKVVKFYYSLRKPQFIYTSNKDSVSLQFKLNKPDSRSFEWYKERQQYGFDERNLWNLSTEIWAKFIKLYSICDDTLLQQEKNYWYNNYNDPKDKDLIDFKLLRNDVKAYNIIKNNSDQLKELAKWVLIRVQVYNNWECPIGIIYKNGKELGNILNLRSLLETHLIQYINGETIDEKSFKLSLFILLKYGW